ncbi:hypothetical protein PVE_R2G0091 [Pseudomonas veronii 1YdBTEX2]|uniref:Uncharacterized protein n=1 Tax=Pseudomonas veronii 1YdBTEX2 TaxID=1295141 RepID=A0A1D3K7D8_PSEVE|nr:hypothetical protein PVE_R2G0091 [Pseudomonas veronii 1YdBTEX2]
MTEDSYEKKVIDAGLFRFPGQNFMKNINKVRISAYRDRPFRYIVTDHFANA